MIDSKSLEQFIREHTVSNAVVISHEPMFGGWNSAMSKAVVDIGEGPVQLVVRGDLPENARVITSSLTAEWELLSAIKDHDHKVAPAARFADITGDRLGQPTILTEFLEGTSLQLAVLSSPPERHIDAVGEMARLAAAIHAIPLNSLPSDLARPNSWESYIDARLDQIRDIEANWIEPDPMLRYLASWLENHRPAPIPLTLVHGDFHTSNIIVDESGSQVAVDWELAHIGDPREDLGWPMIYESIAPPKLITDHQEEFCEAYRGRTGHTEMTVNPRDIAWFSLLNVPLVAHYFSAAAHCVAGGTNYSPTAAMGLVMGINHAEHCLHVIASLENQK